MALSLRSFALRSFSVALRCLQNGPPHCLVWQSGRHSSKMSYSCLSRPGDNNISSCYQTSLISQTGRRRIASSSPALASSTPSAPSTPLTDADTPVHPHLRPPRKLRQVTGVEKEADADGMAADEIEDPSSHASSQQKKRRRRMTIGDEKWPIISYSTAEEYRLADLKKFLQSWQNGDGRARYRLADSFLTDELVEDAVHYKLSAPGEKANVLSSADRTVEEESDVFIFGDGAVVFWNVKKDDAKSLLRLLRGFEVKPYPRETVEHEAEYLDYSYLINENLENRDKESSSEIPAQSIAKLTSDGRILLDPTVRQTHSQKLSLIKYAFSDAIVLSVKLAIHESSLQEYVSSIENVAEDLKSMGRVALSKDQVLRKTGELFFLRHNINLGLNLLDPPDFYWDREDLEALYGYMCVYLNIAKRTKIFNEKLNHCDALVELLRDHLNNRHHVRLERMIIALICVEVFFQIVHFAREYAGIPGSVAHLVH